MSAKRKCEESWWNVSPSRNLSNGSAKARPAALGLAALAAVITLIVMTASTGYFTVSSAGSSAILAAPSASPPRLSRPLPWRDPYRAFRDSGIRERTRRAIKELAEKYGRFTSFYGFQRDGGRRGSRRAF